MAPWGRVMTCNLVRILDHLELPAPVAVGMALVTAFLAKSGLVFGAIGGMVAFQALFVLARLALARSKERQVVAETAASTGRPMLSLVPADPTRSLSMTPPVSPQDPRPAAPRAPFRKAA